MKDRIRMGYFAFAILCAVCVGAVVAVAEIVLGSVIGW